MIVNFDCEFCGYENSQEIKILDEVQAGDGLELEFVCDGCNANNEYVLAMLNKDFVEKINTLIQKESQ